VYPVHGRCTPVYRAVHAVNGRVHGYIHGTYTAVHRAVNTAVYTVCKRPWAAVYRLCTAVHGRCTWSVRVPITPVKQPVRGKTRPGTRPVPDRVRTVYMAVHGRLHGRLYGPCARPCTYHVHGRARSVHDSNTAVYTVVYPVHGRAYDPCTRPCTMYMHVFVACVYGRPRSCTDCVRAMYMVRS